MPHTQAQRLKVDSAERKNLLALLKDQAAIYEPKMPNVGAGAICSGDYLLGRGYNLIGQNWQMKRETNGKNYLFKSITEVEEHTVTAVPVHPFYELVEVK